MILIMSITTYALNEKPHEGWGGAGWGGWSSGGLFNALRTVHPDQKWNKLFFDHRQKKIEFNVCCLVLLFFFILTL
jgi:hypothetical protein